MKKTYKLLGAGAVSLLALKKIQAKNKQISLGSQVIDDLLPLVDVLPIPKNEQELDIAKIKSKETYNLPKYISKIYPFELLSKFDDTLEYLPKNKTLHRKTIFYIHGGAYWSQPTMFHFKTLVYLSNQLNARIVMPIYPKAPGNTAKETLKMVKERYLYLVNNEKINPEDIIVMGDSAGGGCSLSLLQMLKTDGYSLPSKVILLSPWLDVSNENKEMMAIQPFDNMLNIENLKYQGKVYAGNLSVRNPLVSPIYGDYSDYPPIKIFSGTYDILYADSKKFMNMAIAHNWPVEIFTYNKMPHVFSILPTREGKESLKKIISILNE